MRRLVLLPLLSLSVLFSSLFLALSGADKPKPKATAAIIPPPLWSTDSAVTWDYPIVACKSSRFDSKGNPIAPSLGQVRNNNLTGQAGTDLVIFRPDGTETTLVQGGADALGDPCPSFDGTKVYFTRYYHAPTSTNNDPETVSPVGPTGSDIFVVDVASGVVTQLTNGGYAPNRAADDNNPWNTYNAQPCQAPNGRIIFVSNRSRYRAPKNRTIDTFTCTQLYAMDLDGNNVEKIGHLNISSAVSPVILRNGTIAFSSGESQNARFDMQWSLWGIDPDGTSWYPLWFEGTSVGDPDAFHFVGQLSDGRIAMNQYYHSSPFGGLYVWPEPSGAPPVFYGASTQLPAPGTPALSTTPSGSLWNLSIPALVFQPKGATSVAAWSNLNDGHAFLSDPSNPSSTPIGKLTHPSGAPHNDLLVVWTPGLGHGDADTQTQICVIPGGNPTTQPAGMRLLKADPNFNYLFPKALVPYAAIYGMAQPNYPGDLANDGSINPNLPAGTPFGLVGTSSMYKRESFPDGVVGNGDSAVTAGWRYSKGGAPAATASNLSPLWLGLDTFNQTNKNWKGQGAESGYYSNDDVHAVRIILTEPTTDPYRPLQASVTPYLGFGNSANERLRIFGEFPVRKFSNGQQAIVDADGNPDTSWMARIPGDQPFTFQMLDKNGMMLSMAQTWHQVRPGEMRVNCGGCHAHSQVPTDFAQSAAGQASYQIFDPTTTGTSLVTSKANDQSGQQWDAANSSGLKFVKGLKDVEFYRDIKPILDRSCVPCHNGTATPLPGNLRMDDYTQAVGFNGPRPFSGSHFPAKWAPRTYALLVNNANAAFGGYPVLGSKGAATSLNKAGSRYVRLPEGSRMSLIMWKIWGQRLDGRQNADIPTETTPGDPTTLPLLNGATIAASQYPLCDIDFNGNQCPPPGAVDSSGNPIPSLSDDEKRDFARWIDLCCPINYNDPLNNGGTPVDSTKGFFQDDTPPTLTVTMPARGQNTSLSVISFGLADAYSGIDSSSLSVTADFAVDGNAAGTNLAALFTSPGNNGVFAYTLQTPLFGFTGNLTVKVADQQGNRTQLVRHFTVAQAPAPPVPTGLTATAINATQINLSWNASTGATGYVLQRSTDPTNWTTIATQPGTTYSDTNLTPGTTYSYQVAASSAAGTSAFSAAVSATTPQQPTTISLAQTTWTAGAAGVTVTAQVSSGSVIVNEGAVTFSLTLPGSAAITSSAAVSQGTATAVLTPPSYLPGAYTLTASYADSGTLFAPSSTSQSGTVAITLSAAVTAKATLPPKVNPPPFRVPKKRTGKFLPNKEGVLPKKTQLKKK